MNRLILFCFFAVMASFSFMTCNSVVGPSPVLVTSITVTAQADTIATAGGTLQMGVTVAPENATDSSVTWSIDSGSEFASISASGLLTASANGTVVVRATAADGSSVSGTKSITISGQTVATVAVTTITVTSDSDTIATVGGTLQMAVTVAPENATDKSVTWSIESGGDFASINASGLLTASADGTVVVKATAADGSSVSGTKSITISGQRPVVAVTGVTVTAEADTISTAGGTLQMAVTVAPENATDKSVTWSIESGSDFAAISASGLLTSSANGAVVVKATAADGSSASGTKSIAITNNGADITLRFDNVTATDAQPVRWAIATDMDFTSTSTKRRGELRTGNQVVVNINPGTYFVRAHHDLGNNNEIAHNDKLAFTMVLPSAPEVFVARSVVANHGDAITETFGSWATIPENFGTLRATASYTGSKGAVSATNFLATGVNANPTLTGDGTLGIFVYQNDTVIQYVVSANTTYYLGGFYDADGSAGQMPTSGDPVQLYSGKPFDGVTEGTPISVVAGQVTQVTFSFGDEFIYP